MKILDDKTLVPLGLALLSIGGGAAWMTSISLNATAMERTLNEIQKQKDLASERDQQIATDLAVIKTEVNEIKRRLEERQKARTKW